MFNIGPVELIVLLAIGLVFLGPEKLPDVTRIVLRTIRDVRAYVNDAKRDLAEELRPVREEVASLSRFNAEEYVEKLADAIMKDEEQKKEDKAPPLAGGETGGGSNGNVANPVPEAVESEEPVTTEAVDSEEPVATKAVKSEEPVAAKAPQPVTTEVSNTEEEYPD